MARKQTNCIFDIFTSFKIDLQEFQVTNVHLNSSNIWRKIVVLTYQYAFGFVYMYQVYFLCRVVLCPGLDLTADRSANLGLIGVVN